MNGNFKRLDLIRRLSEIRSHYNCFNEKERKVYHTLSEAIEALQEPDWNEMLVICDNCGHAIRVKRVEQENTT